MSAFESASKFAVEEIDRRGLYHVPSEIQATRLKLLSVVEDGNIKEWNAEGLPFELEVDEETLSERRRNFTKTVDGTLREELKGVFGFDLSIGSKVSYEADFAKLAWRKLKNVDSLTQYLESGKLSRSDGKKGGLKDKLSELFWSNSISFKVVTSVVYTTSPTKITLTYQPELGGSATVNDPSGEMFKGKARLGQSKFDRTVLDLQPDTAIAYGCVEVSILKDGSMKVKTKTEFRGKVNPKQPSSTSAEAVQEVPEPDSGSVEPKLANDGGDDEDEEVTGTESEGAVAKVGQGASSTLNPETGKRE